MIASVSQRKTLNHVYPSIQKWVRNGPYGKMKKIMVFLNKYQQVYTGNVFVRLRVFLDDGERDLRKGQHVRREECRILQ